ncbi:MAG TPA: hypothetical protein VIH59_07670 [Candidatus Tectomicrobia bacterium]
MHQSQLYDSMVTMVSTLPEPQPHQARVGEVVGNVGVERGSFPATEHGTE